MRLGKAILHRDSLTGIVTIELDPPDADTIQMSVPLLRQMIEQQNLNRDLRYLRGHD